MTDTIPNVPRYRVEKTGRGFWPYCVRAGDGTREVFVGHQKQCAVVAAELETAFEDGKFVSCIAPSPAGVDGLEVVGYVSQDDIKWQGDCTLRLKPYSDYVIPLCRLSDAQAIIDGLRGEVADLHTTMMAAAVEIQEHWAAHCDEEGYGPANLMHRLERGIASQYGYSAETLVRLESQRDQQAQRIGELEVLLLRVQVSLSLDDTEWGYSGAEKYKLLADIRAALAAGNGSAP